MSRTSYTVLWSVSAVSAPIIDNAKLSALVNATPKQLACIHATDQYRFVL